MPLADKNSSKPSESAEHTKRSSRPMTDSEKQMAAVARKRINHKEIKVFVRNPLKDILIETCEKYGMTQAQYIENLLERNFKSLGLLK